MADTKSQRLGDRIENLEKAIRTWAQLIRKKLLFRLAQLDEGFLNLLLSAPFLLKFHRPNLIQ